MSDKISITDLIAEIRSNLDKFEQMWDRNNSINPEEWPSEIDKSNSGIILEQFVAFDPDELIPSAVDIDKFIENVGYTEAYRIVERRPPMAQCYSISKKAYYRMEAYCINLDALKAKLDELTKDLYVVVTFGFFDHDSPYLFHDDIVKRFNHYDEITPWQEANTGRRESLTIRSTRWLPGKAWAY